MAANEPFTYGFEDKFTAYRCQLTFNNNIQDGLRFLQYLRNDNDDLWTGGQPIGSYPYPILEGVCYWMQNEAEDDQWSAISEAMKLCGRYPLSEKAFPALGEAQDEKSNPIIGKSNILKVIEVLSKYISNTLRLISHFLLPYEEVTIIYIESKNDYKTILDRTFEKWLDVIPDEGRTWLHLKRILNLLNLKSAIKEIMTALDIIPTLYEIPHLDDQNTGNIPLRIPPRKPTMKRRNSYETPIRTKGTNSDLVKYPWYAGVTSRDEAALRLDNTADGSFLIRESPNTDGLAISVRYKNNTAHIKIDRMGEYYYLTDEEQFLSIADLVVYYKNNSLQSSFPTCPTRLTIEFGKANDPVETDYYITKSNC